MSNRIFAFSALIAVALFAIPAAAQDCSWIDVSGSEGCSPNDWVHLQFRNECAARRMINVCVRWTSGPSSGVVNRFAESADDGQVATITPGMCTGDIRYTYMSDGSVPDCP